MFNISPISWPTIVVLIQVCCWFAVVGRSEKFISIIDDEFSFKAIVESYDKTGRNIVERTQLNELYSSEYRRGVVKLLSSNNRLIEYYYDGDLNGNLLEVIPDENLCISGSQYDLHLKLYHSLLIPVMDDVYKAACPECEDKFDTKHLIGAAKILVIVQMLRPKFGRPLGISTRDGSHRAVYHVANIEIGGDKPASIELFVHYDRVLDATSKLSDEIQPQFVRLNYTTKGGFSHTIGLTFYQFNLLLDNHAGQQIERPLSFPTGMYCSRAIGESLGENKQKEVQMIQDMFMYIERLSFTAKIESSAVRTYYAFDLAAKLMRKDFYFEDVRSKTIYDMRTKLKYNKITSGNSPNKITSECVADKMENLQLPMVESNEKFINFEQLVYLGRARINSIDALIFEEYSTRLNSSGMQFWLKPPVLATSERVLDPSFRADDTRGGHSYITYYFATGLGNSSATGEPTIGPLIQIEITIRDAISRIVWQQRMIISDFIVGRLTESNPKLNPVQMFSLDSMNCRFKHQKRGKVSAVLESNLTSNMSPSLLDTNERNEIIIRALDKEYKIRRIQLDQLSSDLKTSNEGDKVVIELEFTISQNVLDERLNSIECVYLGRGKPIIYDSPGFKHYTGIATFEDCMWLARQHSSALNGEQVLFVFTDRLKCLVDRLYRSIESPLETGTSNKTWNLNYYPYEYGLNTNNQKIFTIRNTLKTWPVGSPSDGMYFFQIGSRKLIGQSVELELPGTNHESIKLKFSKLSLGGYLARVFNENFQPMKRITDLSWSESDSTGNWTNKLIALPTKSSSALRLESQMNEAYCRSHCLTDLSCNSYSYCDRLDARETQCLISSIDVSKAIVMKQLENLKDNLMRTWSNEKNGNRVRKAKIMFDEGSLQQPEIEVVLDRTCSISAKSHIDLFKQTYPVKIEGAMIESIDKTIKSKDECAKKCFSKNIDCLSEVANLKQGKGDNQPVPWESISNLAREQMRDFCTGFLYTDEHIPVLNGSACLLAASQSGTDNQFQRRKPIGVLVNETIESISMYQHKFVYSDLFWQLPGLRMRDSGEFEEFIKEDNHEKLLELHSMGFNSQNKLPIDDVQLCARACILQLHGPRPMCSSFDFVHEQMGSTIIRYCLLNSLSFHDLQQKGKMLDQQVLHENQDHVTFWHFEPQDTALHISDSHRTLGISDDARGDHVINYNSSPLMSLSFALILVGLVSGLIIGAKFTSHILDASGTIDEPITQKGRTARLIHRLSGVSLRSNLREVEVQMS